MSEENVLFNEKKLWGNTGFWAFFIMLASLGFSYMIIMHLAEGGDVTWFSMFFLYLFAYFYGGTKGMLFAFIFGVLKFFGDMYFGILDTDHMTAEVCDYLISYGVVGLGGFFSEKGRYAKGEEKPKKKRGVCVQSITELDDYRVGTRKEHYYLRLGYGMAMLFRLISSVCNFVMFYYRPEKSVLGNIRESVIYSLAYVGVETALSFLLLLLPWVCNAAEYCKYVATHRYEADLKTY